jgi:hypothetical protein
MLTAGSLIARSLTMNAVRVAPVSGAELARFFAEHGLTVEAVLTDNAKN